MFPFTDIRLVGGTGGSCQGRVEIYYNNEWGTVCDDTWHVNNVRVVCRELGYTGDQLEGTPYSYAYFGQGSGTIWLDDVNCGGSESSIGVCTHNGWGIENCGHGEDAGVACGKFCNRSIHPLTL